MNTEKIIKDIFFGNLYEAKDDISSLLLQKVGYALEEKKKVAKVTDKDNDSEDDSGDTLDPVGKGDADVDNDGDSDESDEYLKNRRKKISKSVNEWQRPGPGWTPEGGNPNGGSYYGIPTSQPTHNPDGNPYHPPVPPPATKPDYLNDDEYNQWWDYYYRESEKWDERNKNSDQWMI
ncbi:MAG: hypothetical protein H8D80_02280 [Proteobacteria bacterium]|nr:hypothetical protein [Pseudomonadota bacterium]